MKACWVFIFGKVTATCQLLFDLRDERSTHPSLIEAQERAKADRVWTCPRVETAVYGAR
jgi:hypothetical protein